MRRPLAVLLLAGLASLGLASSCNLVAGLDLGFGGNGGNSTSSSTSSTSTSTSSTSTSTTSTSTTSTSTTSTTSTSSTSTSTSTSTGCLSTSDCPAVPPGPCASLGTVTCTGGMCGVAYTVGPAPSQIYGTCQQNECDGDGGMFSVVNDSNVYVNANDCAVNTCVDGGLMTTSATTGKTCARPLTGGMATGVCETNTMGTPVCVQCGGAATSMCTAPTPKCWQNTCVASDCGDGAKSGSETDIDCGGTHCIPCAGGKACMVSTDCQSNICLNLMCIGVSCTDGFQDGPETDVDCGGSCPSVCANGKKCAFPSDCKSGVCMPTDGGPNTCQAPTCTDGVKNGTETGIDCSNGGGPCPPCP
jgi:hypothetical protein